MRMNHFQSIVRLCGCLAVLLLCGVSVSAFAQDIEVTAAAGDSNVYIGQPMQFQVSVNGSQSPGEPIWPKLDGVDVNPQGGQTRTQSFTSIINGRRTETRFEGYVFNYELVFQKAGAQTIPPLTVVVNGKEYHTNAVSVNVRRPQDRNDVRLRISVDNLSPYVGEAIELKATLYLSQTVQDVSLRFPDLDGQFETYDTPDANGNNFGRPTVDFLGSRVPGEKGQSMLDGQSYQTFTLRKWLVPLHEGVQRLGPATLNCEVILRERSFFDDGMVQRAAVPSNELRLDVKALPTEGQPPHFTGLIGRYNVSAAASATDVNIGDPIALTIRVGSTGAVLRDPHINLEADPAFKEHFRISETQSEPRRENGEIVYEQTIRPLDDGVKEIPPITIPYFDTSTGKYAVASTNAIPLNVRPTRIVTAGDAVGGSPDASLGSQVEDASGGIAHNFSAAECLVDQRFNLMLALQNPIWITAIAGPPALYFAALLVGVWRKRDTGDSAGRRRRRALTAARAALAHASAGESSVDRVGRAVRQYVADRFDRPAAGLTTADCAELVSAIDPALGERLRAMLDQCDAARYSGMAAEEEGDLVKSAEHLLAAIDRSSAGSEGVSA